MSNGAICRQKSGRKKIFREDISSRRWEGVDGLFACAGDWSLFVVGVFLESWFLFSGRFPIFIARGGVLFFW